MYPKDLERAKGGSYPSVSADSHLNSRLFFLRLLPFHLCTFSSVLQLQLQIFKDTKKECGVRTRRSSLHPFPPNGPFPPPQNLRSHTQNQNNILLELAFSQRWGGKIISQTESTLLNLLIFQKKNHERDSRQQHKKHICQHLFNTTAIYSVIIDFTTLSSSFICVLYILNTYFNSWKRMSHKEEQEVLLSCGCQMDKWRNKRAERLLNVIGICF